MKKEISKVWEETKKLERMVLRNAKELKTGHKLNLGIKMVDWKKIKTQEAK